MADVYSKIAERLKAVANKGKLSESLIVPAQVKSVSDTTCTVVIDDLEVTDVRLRAVVNGEVEQLLVTPKVGSYVLIADLSGGNYRDFAVISFSEIEEISVKEVEKINIKTENQTLNIDKNGFVFNDGALGGMVKVDGVTQKINALENDINSLKTIFSSWVPAPNDGGASLKTASASWASQQITPMRRTDIENEKIKH
jgi:hypothetical protein